MPRGHGEKYTRLREVALVSLLAHPSIDAAARSVGVSEKCLRLWMGRGDFAEALQNLRQSVIEAGATRLTALVADAVETLREGLKSKKAADRVRSARSILEFRQRFDKDRLQERVAALEQRIAEMKGSANTPATELHLHAHLGSDTLAAAAASIQMRREVLARQRERAGGRLIDNALLPATSNGNGHAQT